MLAYLPLSIISKKGNNFSVTPTNTLNLAGMNQIADHHAIEETNR